MKNRLKEIMDEQGGWTISELVEHLQERHPDITVAVLSGIYHNRTNSIRYDILAEILKFFNLQPNDFFTEVSE